SRDLTSGSPDPKRNRAPAARRAENMGVNGSPKYNRVLLKLSGEALGGSRDYGIDLEVVETIAAQVKRVHQMGVQVAVVVGGGNIFRGLAATERGFDRATGDYMGMLATVINALALQDALERTGIPARTLCMDNDVPIVVFNLLTQGNIERVVLGEEIGTLVGAAT